MKKIIHGCLEIWNFCSPVQLDISSGGSRNILERRGELKESTYMLQVKIIFRLFYF